MELLEKKVFDPFMLDIAGNELQRKVEGSGEWTKIPLRPQAMALLIYLVRHQGIAVKKEDAWLAVLKTADQVATDYDVQVVDHALTDLRKSLEHASRRYIVGAGKGRVRFNQPVETPQEFPLGLFKESSATAGSTSSQSTSSRSPWASLAILNWLRNLPVLYLFLGTAVLVVFSAVALHKIQELQTNLKRLDLARSQLGRLQLTLWPTTVDYAILQKAFIGSLNATTLQESFWDKCGMSADASTPVPYSSECSLELSEPYEGQRVITAKPRALHMIDPEKLPKRHGRVPTNTEGSLIGQAQKLSTERTQQVERIIKSKIDRRLRIVSESGLVLLDLDDSLQRSSISLYSGKVEFTVRQPSLRLDQIYKTKLKLKYLDLRQIGGGKPSVLWAYQGKYAEYSRVDPRIYIMSKDPAVGFTVDITPTCAEYEYSMTVWQPDDATLARSSAGECTSQAFDINLRFSAR